MIKRTAYVVLVVGAITTLVFTIYAARPAGLSQWLFFIAVAGWGLLPYALVGLTIRWLPASKGSGIVLCMAAVLLSAFGAFGLYQSFVVHLDPQSAIVLIFLPLWQLLGLMPFLCMSWYLANRRPAA
ncbi:MAG: hypothetical protein ACE5FV_00730 [Woeseia sp.]